MKGTEQGELRGQRPASIPTVRGTIIYPTEKHRSNVNKMTKAGTRPSDRFLDS